MIRRLTGVVWRPRSTMAAIVAHPTFLTAWAAVLFLWLVPAAWLLSTDVGRQALVDERVRLAENLGGSVDDEAYARLQAQPPVEVYAAGGGRYLLTPPLTLAVAAALMGLARMDGASVGWRTGMAVTVHASLVLALQQALTAPLLFARESLGSPTSLAAVLPLVEEGTAAARVLGTLDVFGLWWIWLLALGLAAATGRPARRYTWRLLAAYLGVGLLMAAIVAVAGGS
ncbi:MAG: YIP1 family protein [Vicinamibacterales bacterium]